MRGDPKLSFLTDGELILRGDRQNNVCDGSYSVHSCEDIYCEVVKKSNKYIPGVVISDVYQ